MSKYDEGNEGFTALAERFRVAGELLGRFGTPKAVERLVEVLVNDDGDGFHRFLDDLDIELLGACYWLRELVERVIVTPTGYVRTCWLRDDLTPDERRLYFMIALRHRKDSPFSIAIDRTNPFGRAEIPEGAFRDELDAAGLLHCEQVMTYESHLTVALGPPERICV